MWRIAFAAACFGAILLAAPAASETTQELARQVRAAEIALAKSLADRDTTTFAALVSPEAVFFSRDRVARGRAAVVADWRAFFQGPVAPFSWEPEQVEVLESGSLGISSGPVRDPKGEQIGTFQSIWRKDADGRWRVIFDKGCPPCASPAKQP